MRKDKKLTARIPFKNEGSLGDVIGNLQFLMEELTGQNIDVDISIKGNITIYVGDGAKKEDDFELLLKNNSNA